MIYDNEKGYAVKAKDIFVDLEKANAKAKRFFKELIRDKENKADG